MPDLRTAARANQRAAAFVRFAMLGDHEAMRLTLLDVDADGERLLFTTALASLTGTLAARLLGRDVALGYLATVAATSAAMVLEEE